VSQGVRAATGGRIVVDEAADSASDGRRFLDAMSDQSQRAHDFNRRMRWFRLRGLLVDKATPPPEVIVLPDAVEPPIPLQRNEA
jgi:hypothetical protein